MQKYRHTDYEEKQSLSYPVNYHKLQIKEVSTKHSEQEQFEALAFYIDQLIQPDFNRLLRILYHIDVSPKK